jgi:hypothetical protein
MEKPSLRLKYGSVFSLVYRRDMALSFIYAAGRGRRRGRVCEEFNSQFKLPWLVRHVKSSTLSQNSHG